jgi:hypothetical protein
MFLYHTGKYRIGLAQVAFGSINLCFYMPPIPTDKTAQVTTSMPAAAIVA